MSYYCCIDPSAILVPLTEVIGPDRKLNEDALRRLLSGVRVGATLPPVVIFREPGAATATLLDGLHRYRLSLALGFTLIPATQPSRDDAELCYRYGK
jgi:ParB-like chromosome segregation protein Spo0J